MADSKDFQYVLCPGSMPDSTYTSLYSSIYKCWREVWEPEYQEAGGKPFFSDAFSRQDYIGALFHNGVCFAMSFFRWTQSDFPLMGQDSYFANWSSETREVLSSRGSRIIVCSYFTVHPYGRGKNLGISGKDLMMGILTETYMHSDADAMTGAVRVQRGVNGAGERWGAYTIEKDVPAGFADNTVDLIGFFKDHINSSAPHELQGIVEEIWSRRIVIPRQDLSSQFIVKPSQVQLVAS